MIYVCFLMVMKIRAYSKSFDVFFDQNRFQISSFFQSLLQRKSMFNKHKAYSNRQFLQRILNIGHFNPILNNKSIVDTFFDEHGSLVQIFIFKANCQRSVTLTIFNISFSDFLE